jgi:hypothetical protein
VTADRRRPNVATTVLVRTAKEYALALIPHLGHEAYRCDRPGERLMGKGCRTCGVEVLVAISDFQANGDLAAFEAELKPHARKGDG